MPQFDITYFVSQIFWLVICFGILTISIVFVFVPRINKIVENRMNKLQYEINYTEKLRHEIQTLLHQREERINGLHEQAKLLVQEKILEIEEKRSKKYKEIDEEVIQTTKNLEKSLQKQRQAFKTSLIPFIDECIKIILPNILGKENLTSFQFKDKDNNVS